MADIDITQAEADGLIAMEKKRVDNKDRLFSPPGETIAIPLISINKREHFILDVSRARIKLTKATYQNRARQVIILMRLDLMDRPIGTRTGKKSRARTFTSIARASAINGQCPPRFIDTRTRWISMRH